MKGKFKLTLVTTLAALVGAVAMCQVCEWLFKLPEQNQVEVMRALAGWTWKFAAVVVGVVILSPVFEELVFRFPTRFVKHPAFAVVISAFFSFCHYVNWQALYIKLSGAETSMPMLMPLSNAFLALFGLGLAWCWLYRKTGCLWCTMLSHSLFNIVNLILALTILQP